MTDEQYSPMFQLVRRIIWAEEDAENLKIALADAESTARNLLSYAKKLGITEDQIQVYRDFRQQRRLEWEESWA